MSNEPVVESDEISNADSASHQRGPGLLTDLQARGLIHDLTDRAELETRLSDRPITVYVGFDPSAPTLHAGNLLPLFMLKRFQDAGHRPIALAGGATGMIGDPSGRSDERSLLDDDRLAENLAGITPQLAQFLDFDHPEVPAKLFDNRSWTAGVGYLEFLRSVGKYVTVNQMAAKESVRSRMQSDQGISYTEFSYMLVQAHDFYWLYDNEQCEMQLGGADQWGNIVLGLDLIRRKAEGSGFALTVPLLTKPDGSKYGKTAGGDTLWLDPDKMSPYRFYQAWIQTPDSEVEKLLLQLTFLSVAVVGEICRAHAEEPQRRQAQRVLARELTTLVHGEANFIAAAAASEVIFGGPVAGIDQDTLVMLAGEIPSAALPPVLLNEPHNLIDVLLEAGIVTSKGEGTRLVKQNGISVNDSKVGLDHTVTADDLMFGRFCLVRKGRKNAHLLDFQDPPTEG